MNNNSVLTLNCRNNTKEYAFRIQLATGVKTIVFSFFFYMYFSIDEYTQPKALSYSNLDISLTDDIPCNYMTLSV